MLKWFKGCKLTLNFLIELWLNIVTEVTIGPFQLIVEGYLGGGGTIHNGSDGISDIQSIVSAGCCYLITCELSIVGEEVHFFGVSILIGEELGSFASGEYYDAWIQKIIVLPSSLCVAEALC